jgi:hypothetical protein
MPLNFHKNGIHICNKGSLGISTILRLFLASPKKTQIHRLHLAQLPRSIVQQDLIESREYSIHGCVHSWTIHVLIQTWNHGLARLALKFIGSHAPDEHTFRPWLTQRRLLQHAMRCSYIVLNNLVPDERTDGWKSVDGVF